ncbi:putative DNA lyase [Podospora didyma]|uniref:DNA lyase n=1 Tax=Podospora didyma TaxID=330526 RepID=A0AAE0NZH6_9PEZI|nr:putative DNA lyase [Podospora didyma]
MGLVSWPRVNRMQSMFDKLGADIIVMQETKIQRKDLGDNMVLMLGWDVYFSLPKYKKGYSGVAIYTRSSKCSPIRAEGITGILCPPNSTTPFVGQHIGGYLAEGQLNVKDEATLDSEGRCITLEFPAFVLIGVYCPAPRDKTRTEFQQAFLDALDIRIRNLIAIGKQVVLYGDPNIIRTGFDTAAFQEHLRKGSMTFCHDPHWLRGCAGHRAHAG